MRGSVFMRGDRPPFRPAAWAPAALTLAVAAIAFGALLGAWLGGGGELDTAWAPSLDLRLHFRLDGLGALYALLATGVGAAVFLYSWRYLPLHLGHERRQLREQPRFYALLLLFMASMVGLATAQDLILLFVFWDLTAVSSYFLIGYDRHRPEARWAALMALLVTGVSAVLLLIGALLLHADHGTFSLPELFERVEAGPTATAAAALIALAALAKSAQVPFHFWLPRAMTAPTPVSAYLHSAAMVAAGVLLIGRAYPLLELSEVVIDALVVVGFASMLVGGALALARDDLKQVLAHSTYSQYGYVLVLYGLGGAAGVVGAGFYVLTHALAKSALFLTAGAVTEATGGDRLSDLGGLGRRMPVLAGASFVAAATLASLPLTAGFFADELLFAAALERGWALAALALGVAVLTFAYLGRFWAGIFLGARTREVGRRPWQLVAPVVALALPCAIGGFYVEPLGALAEAAATSSLGSPTAYGLAYHFDARPANLLALASFALGGVLLLTLGASARLWTRIARLGARFGPDRWYGETLALLNLVSNRIHALEVRGLRTRVATVLMPAALLIVLGFVATPTAGLYDVGPSPLDDLALALILCFVGLAALAVTAPREHLTLVLCLSALGLSLAVVYALLGAPNVALVAVLVETLFTLLFAGIFSLLPKDVLEREAAIETGGSRRWRDPLVAVVAGGVAALVVWSSLSRPSPGEGVAAEQIALAPEAHADNVVTAILADFRALDTLGEVTVLAVALLGVVSLLRRGQLA